MDALELLNDLKELDITAIASETIEDNLEVIADLNATQLSQGLNREGISIGSYKPYKNKDYAQFKYEENPAPGLGNPDLRNTGAFYRGLYAAVNGVDTEIGSKDEKSDSLQDKYSRTPIVGSIFGLTDDSKDELVAGYLQPDSGEKNRRRNGVGVWEIKIPPPFNF